MAKEQGNQIQNDTADRDSVHPLVSHVKANDIPVTVVLKYFDAWHEETKDRKEHKTTRISVYFERSTDSHHIEFRKNVTRAELVFLLLDLADMIRKGDD